MADAPLTPKRHMLHMEVPGKNCIVGYWSDDALAPDGYPPLPAPYARAVAGGWSRGVEYPDVPATYTAEHMRAFVDLDREARAAPPSPPVAAPAEHVAWRERMRPTNYWRPCAKERHDEVLNRPHLWPDVEVQALTPAQPAPAVGAEIVDFVERLALKLIAEDERIERETQREIRETSWRNTAPQPPRPGTAPLSDEQIEQLQRVVENFDDGEDTDVPYEVLMHFAALGLLECGHFRLMPAAHRAIAVAGHPTTPTPKD